MDDKVYFVTGNENSLKMGLLIENILYQKKAMKKEVLLIDSNMNLLTTEQIKLNSKEKLLKNAEYFSKNKIPSISLDKLQIDLGIYKKNNSIQTLENKFNDIYIFEKPDITNFKLPLCSDEIILIITKESNSISFLFKFLKQLLDNEIENKKISIVISNIKNIEDSVGFYSNMCPEVSSLLENNFQFNYLGFVNFDEERISISLNKKEAYIQTFPESAFHGYVKYIIERLNLGRTELREDSFFEQIM